jgi:hypothetical protein
MTKRRPKEIELIAEQIETITRSGRRRVGAGYLAARLGMEAEDLMPWLIANEAELGPALVAAERKLKQRRAMNNARQRRLQENPVARLKQNVRAHIFYALKTGGKQKRAKMFRMLGYTPQELREHLTRLLKPGMTWENYGLYWQIDHIRPVASFNFDVENIEDVIRECWALKNLQPLWALENSAKGVRYVQCAD